MKDTPHAPNTDHDVRIFHYARFVSGVMVATHFRALCSCGMVSTTCNTETEAFDAGFVHLDYQLQDHS